jgi:HlyD family secretion protein
MTKDADLNRLSESLAEKGKWKRRAYWIVPVILFVGGVAIWGVHHKNAAAKNAQQFRTEEARIGDLTVTVTATGQLKPTHTVDVGSQVSGIMDSVLVDYNDHVKNGQVLAKINTEKLDAQVLQDKASTAERARQGE